MKSLGVKRSMMISGRWSSISLEEAFWKGLKGIAADRGLTVSALVDSIASSRHHSNLSSFIRHYVLDYYRTKIAGVSGARGSDVEKTKRYKKAFVPPTPLISINAQYCQERAIQARTLANRTTEPEARGAMLAIAEQYENLANRAELLKARASKVIGGIATSGSDGERLDPPGGR
jgi:predicted DNA-binding ribbon-helix-helix protein